MTDESKAVFHIEPFCNWESIETSAILHQHFEVFFHVQSRPIRLALLNLRFNLVKKELI